MNGVERLCDLLDEEARLCDALAGVLRAEQEAVVQFRAEAILHCVDERMALQERLVGLATQRRAAVVAVANDHGRSAERASELLPLLPIEPQQRLRSRIHAVRRALLEARSLERQNVLLAESSAAHVDELLRALRGLVPGARYGADANLTMPAPDTGLSQRA